MNLYDRLQNAAEQGEPVSLGIVDTWIVAESLRALAAVHEMFDDDAIRGAWGEELGAVDRLVVLAEQPAAIRDKAYGDR